MRAPSSKFKIRAAMAAALLPLLLGAPVASAGYQMQIPVAAVAAAPTGGGGTPDSFLHLLVGIDADGQAGMRTLSLAADTQCSTPLFRTSAYSAPFSTAISPTWTGQFWFGAYDYSEPGLVEANQYVFGGGTIEVCIPGTAAGVQAAIAELNVTGGNPLGTYHLTQYLEPGTAGVANSTVGLGHMPVTVDGTTWHIYGFAFSSNSNGGGSGVRFSASPNDQPSTLVEPAYNWTFTAPRPW